MVAKSKTNDEVHTERMVQNLHFGCADNGSLTRTDWVSRVCSCCIFYWSFHYWSCKLSHVQLSIDFNCYQFSSPATLQQVSIHRQMAHEPLSNFMCRRGINRISIYIVVHGVDGIELETVFKLPFYGMFLKIVWSVQNFGNRGMN